MEMFKKFGTGPARVLVALLSPCTSPGLAMFLSLSSLLSCCPSVPGSPTWTRCLLAFVLVASIFPAQSAAPALTQSFPGPSFACFSAASPSLYVRVYLVFRTRARPLCRLWAVASRVFNFIGVCCNCSLSLLGLIIWVFSFS